MNKKLKKKLNKSPYKQNIKTLIKKIESYTNISIEEKENLIKFYLIAFKLSEGFYFNLNHNEIDKLIEKLNKESEKIDHILIDLELQSFKF